MGKQTHNAAKKLKNADAKYKAQKRKKDLIEIQKMLQHNERLFRTNVSNHTNHGE